MSEDSSDPALCSTLSALQSHFTWSMDSSHLRFLRVLDKVIDICPDESSPWRGQIYNLQGFLQHRLGHSSDALRLLQEASEFLRGPGLLVNYSNLAWLHHERGEPEKSQEYLRRVLELRREHHTEELPHPEELAEKAWTLMTWGMEQKLAAVQLFEAALGAEPERTEWRSSQVLAFVSAHKHDPEPADDELLQRMKRAHEDDPENLYLHIQYLRHRGRRGESVLDEISDLQDRIMVRACSSYSGIKAVLRYYQEIKQLDGAIVWAEEALDNHPDSRYVKRCVALCYKWRVLFTKHGASQRHLDRAVSMLQDVIQLYPHTALVKEMDLADLYSRTERSKAEEIYKRLLKKDMKPPERQMLYNRYAKYILRTYKDFRRSVKYHKKAVWIDHESFFRENSIQNLMKLTKQNRESILKDLSSSLTMGLEELQCHFTWKLSHSRSILFSVRDRLEDVFPYESIPWRGQIYNLQGFLQHRLGHSSDALRLLQKASEVLRGPGLLVNYSNLAWLHHDRGEPEESQEYLRRVQELMREHYTEEEQPHPEVLAEKAFSLMEFYNDKKVLAAELLEKALREQPDRGEWLSAQATALVSAHRGGASHRGRGAPHTGEADHRHNEEHRVLLKIQQAIEQDPQNLMLRAEHLNLRLQQEQSNRTWRSTWRSTEGSNDGSTEEALKEEARALASELLDSPLSVLIRDIRPVLEVLRRAVSEEEALSVAEEAQRRSPDSRFLKSCVSMCLKWQLDQQRNHASQDVINRTATLLRELVSLYPDSCLKTEIELANVYAKSNHSLAQAERVYRDLLRRDLEPVSKQMVLNHFGKFLKHDRTDYAESMRCHMRAAEIPTRSFFRSNSIAILRKLNPRSNRLRRELDDFLTNLQD